MNVGIRHSVLWPAILALTLDGRAADPTVLWQRELFRGQGTNVGDIVADEMGGFYLTGSTRLPEGEWFQRNAYLAKFDDAGNQVWTQRFLDGQAGDGT